MHSLDEKWLIALRSVDSMRPLVSQVEESPRQPEPVRCFRAAAVDVLAMMLTDDGVHMDADRLLSLVSTAWRLGAAAAQNDLHSLPPTTISDQLPTVMSHELRLSRRSTTSTASGKAPDSPNVAALLGQADMEPPVPPPAVRTTPSTSSMYGVSRMVRMQNIMAEVYERVGSWDLLSAAVQHMYSRLFEDDRTRYFFEGKDHGVLISHMSCFMASALAGKLVYTPEHIYSLHKHQVECQGLRPLHVDIMVEHLSEVLADLGASADLIHEAKSCLLSAKGLFNPRTATGKSTPATTGSAVTSCMSSPRSATTAVGVAHPDGDKGGAGGKPPAQHAPSALQGEEAEPARGAIPAVRCPFKH